MKIAVLGAGAMGSLYGGSLAEAGHDVVFIDVWQDQVKALNDHGLYIETDGKERLVQNIRAVQQASVLDPVDLVIVFVKATFTFEAMKGAENLIGQDTMVLTLQNGLGNVEKLNDIVGAAHVIAGTSGHGATLLRPGHIRHAGKGLTVIGDQNGQKSSRILALAEVLGQSGFVTEISRNVMGLIWTKLLMNIGINALTALTGLKNGQLLDFPETESLMATAVAEACAVAQAKGIVLEHDDPLGHVKEVARNTAENSSSMLQDVSAGRQTEIAVINGAVSDEGRRLGIETPVNDVLTRLISVKQKNYVM